MTLFLRLAWRNVWRHRRRTLIVVLAISFTLALMMLYDGLIAGFDMAIYGNAIKILGGNIQIHAAGYGTQTGQMPLLPLADDGAVLKAAQALPELVTASRRINTGGLVTNRTGAFGVTVTGIEPEKEAAVLLVSQHVTSGRYLTSTDGDAIFIGKGLADEMELKVGDRITVAGSAAHSQTRKRTMTVIGIYDVGMPDIEKRGLFISLAEAQDLFGLGSASTEVVLYLNNLGSEPALIRQLQAGLSGYEFGSWQTEFPELETAINTKGGVMNMFGIVMLLIAGIGILNLLLMAVYERTRELGLLSAFGMRPAQISLLFVLEGVMMGLLGVVLGVGFGLLLNWSMAQVGLDFTSYQNAASYMALITTKVYPSLGLEQIWLRVGAALLISVIASLLPAVEAAQSEPAQALHYV